MVSQIPKEWRGPCKITTRELCKKTALQYFIQQQHEQLTDQYDKIIYIGDGENDLCPALSLSANDLVCPRQGYKLESLLKQHCVQAKIVSWKDGTDLLKYI